MNNDKNSANREKRRILFIINPVSGPIRYDDINERIGGIIDYTCFEVEGVFTKYKNHAYELAKQAVEDNIEYVVAVGGDGTVNEVASALVHTKVSLGIIPIGSGNGLARHLKIPGDVDEAIQIINGRTIKLVDSVELNGKYFFNMAGLGFDAHIAKEFENSKIRGIRGYIKLILSEYFKFKVSNYEIFTPEENLSVNALMLCLANSKQWGNGAVISPKSSVSDGVLEICIVKKVPTILLPFTVRKLFNKSIDKSRFIKILKTKNAVIIQKSKLVHLDGEPYEMGNKIDIKVHPTSLHVLVNR